MQPWLPNPDESIGPKEPLGRRLFDQPQLAGAVGQKPVPTLDYRNFEESRDGKVSLDRLGRCAPEKPVIRYLAPRARAAGAKRRPALEFNGWVSIQKQNLIGSKKLPINVVPSPEIREELAELDENIYHSHVEASISVSGWRHWLKRLLHLDEGDQYTPYFLALHLKALFEKHGTILAAPGTQPQETIQIDGAVDGSVG